MVMMMTMMVMVMPMVMMVAMMMMVMMAMVMMVTMSVRHGRGAQGESRTGGQDKRTATQRFEQVEHDRHSWGLRGWDPAGVGFPTFIQGPALGPARGSRHEAIGFNASRRFSASAVGGEGV